jgi:fumarate reductase subunit D
VGLVTFSAAFAFSAASRAWAGVPVVLAQGAPAQVKEGFQYGLGILFMIGFIWGVINIWSGADRLKKGDADGKMGIVSGIIIAGAAAIMAALFYIFGLSGGALTPQF